MAQHSLPLLLLMVLSISCIIGTVEPSFARHSRNRAYLEASCRSTRYPALCVQCLSGYVNNTGLQSPQQLAQLALSVSLNKALYTRAYLLKVAKELKKIKAKEYQMVQDCTEQINNGIDQLSQSIEELRRLNQEEAFSDQSFWHISNVETWVSAALTDATTCVDQFPVHNMSKLKATIKGKVLNMVQVTSNALALFHRYAAKYGAAKP
ncbi:hypothetical protein LWI28_008193 [Acer negundo]|uniref:Pectinesterase inhibitor domain-containing protein n=1 Tax=Acer negundo TaxID=4023 RepID=A0AAD5IYC2_ACENE|nr:hypothetical protein LWI28_008193 [Acer negundo]KAK4848466.1 hypothetical protein QYF36_013410 [Acer negundo]